jgi:alginate O-acetyltransferase complex protein AlgJ
MTEFAQDTIKPKADNPAAPRLLHWLPAAFLLGVVGLGAVATLTSPGFRERVTGKDIITGTWQLTWEKGLDAKVPWRDPSVNLWGSLNYRLFGEARDGALVGKEGWLFTSEEYQTAAGDEAEIAGKLDYISKVRDELSKDGAKLVIVLIPAKTRLYPEVLSAQVPRQNAKTYDSFRTVLSTTGIAAPDLLASFQAEKQKAARDLFLHTDTHWTPEGARIAAQTVALSVQELAPDLPPAEYTVQIKPATERQGDLLRYVPGPAPDRVRELEYTRTDEGGGGLLGDETLAVTLVGTSYSAETKDNVWHFAGALSQVLNTEVLNVAQEGKGPIVPMREYLKSDNRKTNPPQVVVWEIPERFLRVNYQETK